MPTSAEWGQMEALHVLRAYTYRGCYQTLELIAGIQALTYKGK